MKSVDDTRSRGDARREDSAHAEMRIVRVIRAIPRGSVASYGEIATRAGLPGRARLVGRVLGTTLEYDLPWFRVLRSDGRIAFPPGSRAFREQVRHLAAEGILVVRGRVDTIVHGWDRNLDAVLWAPPSAKKTRPGRKSRARR